MCYLPLPVHIPWEDDLNGVHSWLGFHQFVTKCYALPVGVVKKPFEDCEWYRFEFSQKLCFVPLCSPSCPSVSIVHDWWIAQRLFSIFWKLPSSRALSPNIDKTFVDLVGEMLVTWENVRSSTKRKISATAWVTSLKTSDWKQHRKYINFPSWINIGRIIITATPPRPKGKCFAFLRARI